MQTLIRAECMALLKGVSVLVGRYVKQEGDFVAETDVWLAKVEGALAQLRHASASMVGAERARLASVADGFVDPDSGASAKTSRRKTGRLVARSSMARIEEVLRHQVFEIDERFGELRDKLAQAVAVAHDAKPLALPVRGAREAWLRDAWQQCRSVDRVAPLFLSLEAALRPMDRLHLIDDVVRNLEAQT